MKSTGGSEEAKRRAGESAAAAIEDDMIVGLGTGSTAGYAIRALGQKVDAGLDIRGIATSIQSRELAREAGIPLCALEDGDRIDVAIDGADQVAGTDLLKGGGAAHTREKIIASAADRFLVVVDDSKLADQLSRPVPIEILPSARAIVAQEIRELGGEPELRTGHGKDGPVVTEHGNLVLDVDFGPIDTPESLGGTLSSLPGVVDHGLFVGLADEILIGTESSVTKRQGQPN